MASETDTIDALSMSVRQALALVRAVESAAEGDRPFLMDMAETTLETGAAALEAYTDAVIAEHKGEC